LFNSPDASVCDQCGEDLPGTPAEYSRRDGEDILCHHCESYNEIDAHFCDQCGHPIPRQAYVEEAEKDWNVPTMTSSSGRDGTDPYSRAQFLESLRTETTGPVMGPAVDDGDGGKLFRQIDAAERAVARAEQELNVVRGQVEAARSQVPELDLPGHEMSPSARSWFLAWRRAEGEELVAERALNDANATLRRLLGVLDDIQKDGMGLPRPVYDDGEGITLGDAERSVEAARRSRRNR
jgi:hypothetical protein